MALKIKSIFCSTVMLWLNRETTFFAAFSPSTLTSYHTPSQTNAYTFCIHNSTFTPLLMEYIICTLLGKIYCTTLHRVLYTHKWLWGLFSLYLNFLVWILFTSGTNLIQICTQKHNWTFWQRVWYRTENRICVSSAALYKFCSSVSVLQKQP